MVDFRMCTFSECKMHLSFFILEFPVVTCNASSLSCVDAHFDSNAAEQMTPCHKTTITTHLGSLTSNDC